MACVVTSYIVAGFVWFWSPLFPGKYLGINLLAVVTSYLIPLTCAVLSGMRGKHRANLRNQQPKI